MGGVVTCEEAVYKRGQPRTDVYAIPELLLVELRGAHIQPLEHLKHEVGLAALRDCVHVQRKVQNCLPLCLRKVAEGKPVELFKHLEPGEAEIRSVGEYARDERVDACEPLLAINDFKVPVRLLIEEKRRHCPVGQLRLVDTNVGRRTHTDGHRRTQARTHVSNCMHTVIIASHRMLANRERRAIDAGGTKQCIRRVSVAVDNTWNIQ